MTGGIRFLDDEGEAVRFDAPDAAALLAVLGYCDSLDIGVNVDPAAVTDIDGLMLDIAAAFDDLLA